MRQIFFVLWGFCILLPSAMAGWVADGPFGRPQQVMSHPSLKQVLFSAANGSFFRSTDNGRSWTRVRLPAPFEQFRMSRSEPYALWAASVPIGTSTLLLHKSLDLGQNWEIVSTVELQPFRFYAGLNTFELDPRHPQTMFAAIDGIGFLKSTDSGRSWKRAMTGLARQDYFQGTFSVSASETGLLYMALLGAHNHWIVELSRDSGGLWVPVADVGPHVGTPILRTDPLRPGTAYFAISNSIYKTVNHGSSWSEIRHDQNAHRDLTIDEGDSKRLIAIAGRQATLSRDGGKSCTSIVFPKEYVPEAISVHNRPDGSALIASGPDLLLSDDYGVTWAVSNEGINNIDITHISAPSDSPGSLIVASPDGVYETGQPAEKNWRLVYRSIQAPAFRVKVSREDPAILGISSPGSGAFLSTKRTQVAWIVLQGPEGVDFAFGRKNATIYFANGKSVDGGHTLAKYPMFVKECREVQTDPFDGNTVYLLGREFLSVSNDAGTTWHSQQVAPDASPLLTLAIDPTDANVLFVGTGAGLWKSSDRGSTWAHYLRSAGYAITAIAVDAVDHNRVYAIANAARVVISQDGGEDWEDFDDSGLDDQAKLRGLVVDTLNHEVIHVATSRGVFTYLPSHSTK